ncbi:MAG: hypothetical protein E3J66_03675 [Dehalococcoidia bacterium]|nr:MAG: hypothetical protein E3J66_03675 [Dehalococcoidia bacterium]
MGSNPSRPTRFQLQKNAKLLTKSRIQSQANLLTRFVNSRRESISPRTIDFYRDCLTPFAEGYEISSDGINSFLANLGCGNAKLNYYRAIKAFCNWLHRQGYIPENPIRFVDAPKPSKQILPSLTMEQVQYLMEQCDNLRDKAIISLLADSGMRLNELANIHASDIDWDSYVITIIGKGNKQRKAPFTERTAKLLRQCLPNNGIGDNIWHMEPHGIQSMLRKLELETGIKCNAHGFRRGFACNLHRKGLSTLDIMHLGGWEDLSMVLRYTRSITFEDCLQHYREALVCSSSIRREY